MLRAVPRVLLVDDEPVLLRLLEMNLRAAGFEVRTASSGAAALAVAAEHVPDAIVLDVGLPDLDGGSVVSRLRADPATAGVQVILLSGADRDALAGHGYAAEVQVFLTKPVEPAHLVETVRRLTRRDV